MPDLLANESCATVHAPDTATPGALDVALIGYQDQGNLGMGYLAAVLREHGRTVEMIDIRDGPADCGTPEASPAARGGFFAYISVFPPAVSQPGCSSSPAGITSHFTIGGHYPSLCHDELLRNFPEIDSVARYEGEATLLELVERLSSGEDWRETPGLAYLSDDHVVESEPRALVQDLDSLPFPYRPLQTEQFGGFPTLPLLASRGCAAALSVPSTPSTAQLRGKSSAFASRQELSRRCSSASRSWRACLSVPG